MRNILSVSAASRAISTNAVTTVGTVKMTCTAEHYSSGNTRWNYWWNAYAVSSGLMNVTSSSTRLTITEHLLRTEGTATAVNYSYVMGSASRTARFNYNGNVSGYFE